MTVSERPRRTGRSRAIDVASRGRRRGGRSIGGATVDRRPTASQGTSAERHRTGIARATRAGGADQEIRPYDPIEIAHVGGRMRTGDAMPQRARARSSTDGRPDHEGRPPSATGPASRERPQRAGRIRRSARTTRLRLRTSAGGCAPATRCRNEREHRHRTMAVRITRVVRGAPVDPPRADDPSGRGGPGGPPLRRR